MNDEFGYYYYDRTQAWQSFTAGADGFLAAVQLLAYTENGTSWTATFEVRKGEGMSGVLLASQSVSGDGSQLRTFVLNTPLRQWEGEVFTFVLRNISTPITVRASGNKYASGRCMQHPSYDYNFKTWVLASDWAEEEWRGAVLRIAATAARSAAPII